VIFFLRLLIRSRACHKLTYDEVKVLVEEIDIDRHPIFNYEMEKGSYITWKVEILSFILHDTSCSLFLGSQNLGMTSLSSFPNRNIIDAILSARYYQCDFY